MRFLNPFVAGRRYPLLAAGLLLASMSLPAAQEAGETTLSSLSISEGSEETGIQILTEGARPDFTCSRRVVDGRPGLALSFPSAFSRLQDSYPGAGTHLRQVEVVTTPVQGPAPVEIILHLNGDSFWSLQQTRGRIRVALRRAPVPVQPSLADAYRVGPGDRLSISVFGHEDLSKLVEVKADGAISFPLLGEVRVRDLTVEEIAGRLRDRLGKDFLVDPQISVDVDKYQSQWVSVVGEVRSPGKYYLKGVTTLIEVIAEAGGTSDDAGAEILVSRRLSGDNPGTERQQVNIRRESLFTRMDPEENIVLHSGDIINVLPRDYFFIRGEVNKSGSYPLESDTTLLKAISLAGGVGDFANRKEVEIFREVNGKQERIKVNLKAIENRKQDDIQILPNDVIHVPRKFL